MEHSFLLSVFVFLASAILVVPIVKLSGLGSVIGYLLAGILIGPSVAGFITEPETILHFSEFGVVMMLFLIGLELQLKELWHMRHRLLGLGGLQVAVTTLAITLLLLAFSSIVTGSAIVIGMAFALSSTAVAIQVMQDRKILKTEAGQSTFSVLLFQDVIVIAMIAMIPLLAENFPVDSGSFIAEPADHHSSTHNVLSGWTFAVAILAVFCGMIIAGRLLLQPLFKIVARSKVRETFTAIALALVIGAALLMQWLGLSAALGAFFAGVVLADSNYRHQLERDLEPFKALLLGLFFISVGMSLDFTVIADSPFVIVGSAVALLILKAVVLLGVGRLFGLSLPANLLFACLICQAGEFGFVLFQFAAAEGLMSANLVSQCNAVIAISMAMTPVLLIVYDKLVAVSVYSRTEKTTGEAPVNKGHKALILGFGRVGQVASRLLHTQDIETTIIDHDGDHIEFVRQFGNKVYYGDAADVDLLRTAGAETADVVLICIDDQKKATETANNLKKYFPNTKILARARNRTHMFDLMELDVDFIERETVRGSLAIGRKALEFLGLSEQQAIDLSDRFLEHDYQLIEETWSDKDNLKILIDKAKASRELIKQTLNAK